MLDYLCDLILLALSFTVLRWIEAVFPVQTIRSNDFIFSKPTFLSAQKSFCLAFTFFLPTEVKQKLNFF